MRREFILAAAICAALPAQAGQQVTAEDMAFGHAAVRWADRNCTGLVPPALRLGLSVANLQPTEAKIGEAFAEMDEGARARFGDTGAACKALAPVLAGLADDVGAALDAHLTKAP